MQLNNYKILKIPFLNSFHHHLFFKQHTPKTGDIEGTLPERTLFVANIPIGFEESDIKKIFSKVGPVTSVLIKFLKTDDQIELSVEDALTLDEKQVNDVLNQNGKF